MDAGRSLGLVEGVRSLVLLAHPVDDEHDAEYGAQEADHGAAHHGWKKKHTLSFHYKGWLIRDEI